MPPTPSKRIAFQDRMVSLYMPIIKLKSISCAMNPEHCDVAFPSEPLNVNGEKSYSILRFELSQLSSECVSSIWIFDTANLVQNSQYGNEGAETRVLRCHRPRP